MDAIETAFVTQRDWSVPTQQQQFFRFRHITTTFFTKNEQFVATTKFDNELQSWYW